MARVVSNVERKLNPNPREHFRRAAAEAECREPHVSCWEDVEASEGEKAKASFKLAESARDETSSARKERVAFAGGRRH